MPGSLAFECVKFVFSYAVYYWFQVASLGAINQKNNSALSGQIAAAFAEAPFGIQGNRIYVEFRDVSAANMGYNGATFAG